LVVTGQRDIGDLDASKTVAAMNDLICICPSSRQAPIDDRYRIRAEFPWTLPWSIELSTSATGMRIVGNMHDISAAALIFKLLEILITISVALKK
jgi:hypothetical protein